VAVGCVILEEGGLKVDCFRQFTVFEGRVMTDSEPQAKKKMSSSLTQLKNFTTVVADTGDFEGNSRHFCVEYLCNSCYAKLHNLPGCPRARSFLLHWKV
jgi:hypothetical protein